MTRNKGVLVNFKKKMFSAQIELEDNASYAIEAIGSIIARFVGKVQKLESGLETGVTGASPPTVTSMGSSFYLGGQVQGRRP